jgi:hypothetical protein
MRSVVLFLLVACGGEEMVPEPEQACEDTADVVAEKARDCGLNSSEVRRGFVSGATGGQSCSVIVRVRDEAELRDVCFPALRALSCDNFANGEIPESCRNQLLRSDPP